MFAQVLAGLQQDRLDAKEAGNISAQVGASKAMVNHLKQIAHIDPMRDWEQAFVEAAADSSKGNIPRIRVKQQEQELAMQQAIKNLGEQPDPASKAIDTCSPLASSMSISRWVGAEVMALARPVNSSVVWPMAETTTTTSCPSSRQRPIRSATALMRSTLPTEVPPNFWTRRAMGRASATLDFLTWCAAITLTTCVQPGV